MYTVGQSISHCPLLVFGAARFSRFPLPAARQTSLQTLPHRSPGSGQEVTCFQSSNDRHRSNRSSIYRHLISVAILHGVFQEIIVEFRKKRKLVSFVCEDVQFEIHKVFLNRVYLGNLIQGDQPGVCVLELLQKFLILHGSISRGTAGRQICLQLF